MRDILEKGYLQYQNYIKAIYSYGSRVNPYIRLAHDYDFLVFAKNTECSNFLRPHSHDLVKHNIHLIIVNTDDFCHRPVHPSDYLYFYIRPVIGFYSAARYSVLEHAQEYRCILCNHAANTSYKDPKNPEKTNKILYHILQGLFMLDNSSFHLYPEQEKVINQAQQSRLPFEGYEGMLIKCEIINPKNKTGECVKRRKYIIRGGKKIWIEN